jgi:hypothetical protein
MITFRRGVGQPAPTHASILMRSKFGPALGTRVNDFAQDDQRIRFLSLIQTSFGPD